jgi:hypothetical protein
MKQTLEFSGFGGFFYLLKCNDIEGRSIVGSDSGVQCRKGSGDEATKCGTMVELQLIIAVS